MSGGRHLHLDLVGGIAGDMTVAALVDAGADVALLEQRLRASGLPFTAISVVREWKGGMAGARFSVQAEVQAPSRHWRDIRVLLQRATLPDRARQLALDIFGTLAEAEGQVHGCTPDEVHFHEVGAMDSIVDIVGAALALDLLDVTTASCSAVPVCAGSVRGDHGVMPLPAPATARLLLGFTLVPIPGSLETVTPTGAAILATLCRTPEQRAASAPPPMRLLATGTGMGSAELADRPNVLRALLGERIAAPVRAHGEASAEAPAVAPGTVPGAVNARAVVLEAAIDDMDPRVYGAVAQSLFAAGALDVTLQALQMKKQRPGTLLTVLARPELEGALTAILLRETTTLGVRAHDVRRTELARRHERVATPFGEVRVKLGLLGDTCVNMSPEYDDCERAARAHGVPVKDVLAAALAAAAERHAAHEAGTC